jgi:predicted phosphoribosyltransferase
MADTSLNGRRTPEAVRRDIDAEREELAVAVEQLRGGLSAATDVSSKLRANLPVVTVSALGAGFFLAGGIGATMRLLARKGRER